MVKKVLCKYEILFNPEDWTFSFPMYDIGTPFFCESDQIRKEFVCGSKTIDGETLFYGKLIPVERILD